MNNDYSLATNENQHNIKIQWLTENSVRHLNFSYFFHVFISQMTTMDSIFYFLFLFHRPIFYSALERRNRYQLFRKLIRSDWMGFTMVENWQFCFLTDRCNWEYFCCNWFNIQPFNARYHFNWNNRCKISLKIYKFQANIFFTFSQSITDSTIILYTNIEHFDANWI